MKRPIILIGLPGAGKSTVGARVASELGGTFVDVDAFIEEKTGRTVRAIFREDGEGAFRDLERKAVAEALESGSTRPAVVAPGGGWAAQPGVLEAVDGLALVVHLVVSPDEAADRLAQTGDRPLLLGGPMVDRLRTLMSERSGNYARAAVVVETDHRSVEAVVREVVELARKLGGW